MQLRPTTNPGRIVKALIVYWHPEPQSFNHAMFSTAQRVLGEAGGEVKTSDLHAMRFNPISDRRNFHTVHDPAYLKLQLEEIYATQMQGFADDLEAELQKVEWCDLLIFQFPLWWFSLPAALKGWVDRVFAMGRTYGDGKFYETGVFHGKRVLLSLTTGGPPASYVRGGFGGDIMEFLKPIHRGMFQFVGFDVLAPQVVYAPAHITEEARKSELDRWAERLRRIGAETPIEVGVL
jgi:putative NADPH-quinone reductase